MCSGFIFVDVLVMILFATNISFNSLFYELVIYLTFSSKVMHIFLFLFCKMPTLKSLDFRFCFNLVSFWSRRIPSRLELIKKE